MVSYSAKKKQKVFVGPSGGVDSAVSAALLQKEGYEVTGVFIRIVIPGYPCTAGQDRIDAMRVAAHLKISFIEVDFSKEYEQEVFRPSLKGFREGETPNPDILCNRQIKFGKFFEFCKSRGADLIATGHYARITKTDDSVSLLAGKDPEKDQSYFLWSVPETVLRYTLFPVGDKKKAKVRALAKKFALPNVERPDSQGLCFLGPISIDEMLERELKSVPGNVLCEDGTVIGTHEGAAHYTLGQRHGFILASSSPDTLPHFVIGKDMKNNTITVSAARLPLRLRSEQAAQKTEIILRDTNWIGDSGLGSCEARFRYRQKTIPATLKESSVTLREPHFVPLGQSLVLYRGERCLGGGVIENATLQ